MFVALMTKVKPKEKQTHLMFGGLQNWNLSKYDIQLFGLVFFMSQLFSQVPLLLLLSPSC